ncbi:unnamed protein product [Rotaria sp. Silwood2]|nr:unnamed protein product [Rotaria sp. Silwood2]
MKKNVLTTIKLNDPFYPEIWNQHMINVYYKYCLENCVLPKIYYIEKETTQQQCLDLIGSISSVNKAKEKYELMSEIERQRILLYSNISKSDEQLSTSPTQILNNICDSYNIIINCCSDDKILSHHLANRLIDEGYLVSIDYSDKTSSTIGSKFNKTDLILICFSSNYSENANSMTSLYTTLSSGKKYIPIMLTKNSLNHVDDWLRIIHTEELYYDSFKEEIKFKLDEDLALNYDKLLIELLHYMKPGTVGRTYLMSNTMLNKEEQEEENFDQSNIFSQFTSEQIQEKEQIYQKQIEEILERDKISDDELTYLISSLKQILENCENEECSTSTESTRDTSQDEVEKEEEEEEQYHINEDNENQQNEKQEVQLSENEENYQNKHDKEIIDVPNYLSAFLSSIQRWLEKASNGPVIKSNLPPFTLTGDFNDAIFQMPSTNKVPWWVANANLDDFDHSPLEHHSESAIGPCISYDDAHHHYQKIINKDFQFQEYKQEHVTEVEQDQTNTDTITVNTSHHSRFNTTIKRGTNAWDIIEDRQLIQEYERRLAGEKSKESDRYNHGWNRILERTLPLISDIKEGKIDMTSNDLQGKIGTNLKTKKEIKELNALDDPNNELWKNKKFSPWRRKFIQTKLSNTIKWQEFCAAQTNK